MECFQKHDPCSGPAKEWRPKLVEPDPRMVMYACDKHFHRVWAPEGDEDESQG